MATPGGPTIRQLETLTAVQELGSIAAAAQRLGGTPQQVTRSLNRLGDSLGLTQRLYRYGPDQSIEFNYPDLVERARQILDEVGQLREVKRSDRTYWIRVNAFAAHVAGFLGESIQFIEERYPHVQVELVKHFGVARSAAGSRLADDLRAGAADVVIAPWRRNEAPADGSSSRELYRSCLVAAVSPDHAGIVKLRKRLALEPHHNARLIDELLDRRLISLPHLLSCRLVTSPPGHMTRLMLEAEAQRRELQVSVEFASADSAALLALGRVTDRIPIMASDVAAAPLVDNARHDWLAIVDPIGDLIEWTFNLQWQADDAKLPTRLREPLAEFVDDIVKRASAFGALTMPWKSHAAPGVANRHPARRTDARKSAALERDRRRPT